MSLNNQFGLDVGAVDSERLHPFLDLFDRQFFQSAQGEEAEGGLGSEVLTHAQLLFKVIQELLLPHYLL